MDEKLLKNAEKLIEYREKIKKKMFWNTAPNEEAIMCAFLHLAEKKELDVDKYVECKKILKNNAGIFSQFRGVAQSLVLTKMMMRENPEEYLLGVKDVYNKFINRHKLSSSPFVVMASMTIFETTGANGVEEYLDKIDELYKKLKENHPWLVWNEDYGYLSMLATTNANVDLMVDYIESSYQALKGIAISKDSVHSLAQVLALSPMSPEQKTTLVREIVTELKDKKHPIDKTYGLSSVGTLTLLTMPKEEIIQKIIEVDEYLKDKKGFRINGGRIRRLFAALLVFLTYADENNVGIVENITGTLVSQVIEEIIALIILVSVNTTAAVTASTN